MEEGAEFKRWGTSDETCEIKEEGLTALRDERGETKLRYGLAIWA